MAVVYTIYGNRQCAANPLPKLSHDTIWQQPPLSTTKAGRCTVFIGCACTSTSQGNTPLPKVCRIGGEGLRSHAAARWDVSTCRPLDPTGVANRPQQTKVVTKMNPSSPDHGHTGIWHRLLPIPTILEAIRGAPLSQVLPRCMESLPSNTS